MLPPLPGSSVIAIWFIILVAAIAALFCTWHAGEWACRGISRRYAGRRRPWTGIGPDDDSHGGPANG